MEWWQIVTSLAVVVGAAFEFSARFLPAKRKRREEKQNAKATLKKALGDITNKVQAYEYLERQSRLREWVTSAFVPKRWRPKLAELADLTEEYNEWRWESWCTTKVEIQLALKNLSLDEMLNSFGLSGMLSEGRERTPGEVIHKVIYQGNLTFELAKEATLKDRWDSVVKVQDKDSGEGKELKLKEAVEGKAFHDLVDELQRLQKREVIKSLRDTQLRLLNKAQIIMKAI